MKITQDIREYAAEQGLETSEAIERGMAEKSEEVREKGGEVYVEAGD